jgi:hypothetical protein
MNIEDSNYPFENGLMVIDFIDLVNFDIVNVRHKIDEGKCFGLFCCRYDGYKTFLCSLFIA